jgi:hypothetical protein
MQYFIWHILEFIILWAKAESLQQVEIGVYLKDFWTTRYVMDDLTYDLRLKWAKISGQLLEELNTYKRSSFDSFIICDKLWFFLKYSPDHIWQLVDNDAPESVSRESELKRTCLQSSMAHDLWSTSSACVPSGMLFNSKYFCDAIVAKLLKVFWLPWEYHDENDSSSLWTMSRLTIPKRPYDFSQ